MAPHRVDVDSGSDEGSNKKIDNSNSSVPTNSNDVLKQPKKIWATLVSTVDYLPGVFVLDHSLKQFQSQYSLLVLYTDALPPEAHRALDLRGFRKRHISALQPCTTREYGTDTRFHDTWSKLAVFSLYEYDRVVLLDSDMLVLQNMDELMDLPLDDPSLEGRGDRVFAAAHACVCNPMKRPHYPSDWIPENCGFTDQHSDPELAQTQGSPNTRSHGMPNSGTVVANPSKGVFDRILAQLEDAKAVQSYSFPDQALLGDVFYGRWVPLPYVYNALKTLRLEGVHAPIWRDDRVKVIHYILSPKPWAEDPSEDREEVSKWWHSVNEKRITSERKRGIDDGL